MTIALGIIIILVAIALTVLVLMQTGKGKELSGAIAGGTNSYLGNSGMSDKDKLLFKVTAALAIVLVVLVLVLYVIL
ncbi:MAG: preprotein translocase subunit SecG [Clostridia bacterium]|nr:preprotein translocase subunit SecG [Clostridia bacterium]